ncbi:MAG: 2-amino-4-hydroxy-6-hydroxymethyldihydropteridine diphosphokinase [Pseudobutyrivibrio sp.]|nr:2-amino-4-hydroxy-6-hydroxymethyldihydropteridine diphosphokinase [Pseudobutyrivibrio sp.]
MRYDILVEKLEGFGYHGVLEEEKRKGQKFIVSARLTVNSPDGVDEDNCEKTVNYSEVSHLIVELIENTRFDLIEALADHIAKTILIQFSLVEKVTIQVDKPGAPIELQFENVAVVVERSWHTVYVGLGSNMGDCEKNISTAVERIRGAGCNKDVVVSTLIKTKPYGNVEQDDFLNGACVFKTMYQPKELLRFLQKIELDLKRTREIHWGPRTIDLDIELYDALVVDEENLTIPHPDMHNRDFVLKPLCELNPRLVHPVYKRYLADFIEK